jgi:hypothetical protein
VKDELDDLPEWIEYHRRMGVSKFYVFDHNSSVPMLNTIARYVASDLVDYVLTDFRWTSHAPQIATYNRCLEKYGHLHKFMAFIDSDEYIVVAEGNKTIPNVLHDYERYGGVALNWMFFGSSGHLTKPPGGIIANYDKCNKDVHVKVIANTQYTRHAGTNPHYFVYTRRHYAVSPCHNFTRVDGPYNPETTSAFERMFINHYNTRSLSEFLKKMARGRGAMHNPNRYSLDYFHAIDRACQDTCPILQMPPLRENESTPR